MNKNNYVEIKSRMKNHKNKNTLSYSFYMHFRRRQGKIPEWHDMIFLRERSKKNDSARCFFLLFFIESKITIQFFYCASLWTPYAIIKITLLHCGSLIVYKFPAKTFQISSSSSFFFSKLAYFKSYLSL